MQGKGISVLIVLNIFVEQQRFPHTHHLTRLFDQDSSQKVYSIQIHLDTSVPGGNVSDVLYRRMHRSLLYQDGKLDVGRWLLSLYH